MTSRNEKRTSYGRNIIILLLLTAITFAVILRGNDLEHFLLALKHANIFWLTGGLGCMFLFVTCEALNIHSISKTIGRPLTIPRCEQYAFIGFYFSSITPSASGGQPAQMYYMKKDQISLADSSLIILFIVMVYQISMLLLAGCMSLFHPGTALAAAGQLRILLPFGLIVNGFAAFTFALLVYSENAVKNIFHFFIHLGTRLHLVKSPESTWNQALKGLSQYQQSGCMIRQEPRLFFRVLATSLIQLSALSLVPYCVYKAMGLQGHMAGELITRQSILTISASAIPTPGAVGAAEYGFLTAFKDIFGPENIKTAMLLSRGISLYLFLIISFFICMAVHLRTTKQT